MSFSFNPLTGNLDLTGVSTGLAITDTYVVNSEAEMLVLTAQQGDVAIRTDLSKTFILQGTNPTILSSWVELMTPPDTVLSVNGQVGSVNLTKSDVGLGNVDNTSDLNKPISTATQTALNLITNINWTGDYNNGVTYSVGDGVMFNGASFRMISFIGAAGYTPTAYPANWLQITDYVSPNDIGLGNVDNTSDLNKPISTATQDALDLKYDASNPAGYITLADVPTPDLTPYLKHDGTVPLDNNVFLTGRNAANTANIDILKIATDDSVHLATNMFPEVDGNIRLGKYDLRFHSVFTNSLQYSNTGNNISLELGTINTGPNNSIDFQNRRLVDSTGLNLMLDWSTVGVLDVKNNKISNLIDPTANQDAATKKYVDDSIAALPPATAVWGSISGDITTQTDLQTALSAKFDNPTGDTTQYIAGDGSLQLLSSITATQSESLITEVFNQSGSPIRKMIAVYINGSHGDHPTIAVASSATEATSSKTYGIVNTADITNMTYGFVTVSGRVRFLNTDNPAWTQGDALWLATSISTFTSITGPVETNLTNVKPSAPIHAVYVGTLIRKHQNQGEIEVKVQNGYELEELHNVKINTPIDEHVLVYDASTDPANPVWKNELIGNIPTISNKVNKTGDTLTGPLDFPFTDPGVTSYDMSIGHDAIVGSFTDLANPLTLNMSLSTSNLQFSSNTASSLLTSLYAADSLTLNDSSTASVTQITANGFDTTFGNLNSRIFMDPVSGTLNVTDTGGNPKLTPTTLSEVVTAYYVDSTFAKLIHSVAAGETVAPGDALYISKGNANGDTGRTAGLAYKVDATNDNRMEYVGIAGNNALINETVNINIQGNYFLSPGLTPGLPVFVSTTTPGGVTQTIPSTPGHWLINIGIASSTSEILLNNSLSSNAIKITNNSGSLANLITNTATSYSPSITIDAILCNAASGAQTINLPTAVGYTGKIIDIKKTDSTTNSITIDANASETIDGALTKTIISQYQSIRIISDGSNWFII